MLANHPRGLIVAFFANMGERFGFYTMMAILVFFLQARYGLDEKDAGFIYGGFYFLIYALALLGGFIADRTRNYKGTIQVGIIIMFLGYAIMAIPGVGLPIAVAGLATIAFGNGLFKGNLQALVGQMYDAPQYQSLRDSAYSIFYMGINIGAVFAPNAAMGIRNWYLGTNGLGYDGSLPNMCNAFLKDASTVDLGAFQKLADQVSGAPVADLTAFASKYVDVFSTGYNYAFGVAACSMLVSMLAYVLFKRHLPDAKSASKASTDVQMPWAEEKRRLIALGLVFLVVIFFWMSFHQNGLTMTYFARDYTVKTVDSLEFLAFDIRALLAIGGAIIGLWLAARRVSTMVHRLAGVVLSAAGLGILFLLHGTYELENKIAAETFQQFNPFFVVFLTPVVVGFFGWLRSRNAEPSSPRKIAIGMVLAGIGFVIMLLGSLGLPSPAELKADTGLQFDRVGPHWLISSYFILTIAELFLSPMGISFVSKVAPPRFQGMMQGGWLGATALGNQLLVVGSVLWGIVDVWMVWGVFVVCCLASAAFIMSIMKRLEAATGSGK